MMALQPPKRREEEKIQSIKNIRKLFWSLNNKQLRIKSKRRSKQTLCMAILPLSKRKIKRNKK